ncbi:PBECR4 domain-containing protein [uncultured Sneathia sp.]|uniref:PBECR4 domain-containing protein n=1 Tax=uncultured Sneathia sp. TaxID=278067 RepID=UPI00259BC910|nr:PBECR4 domain-containing protein [uncultured Sneathia sp.]
MNKIKEIYNWYKEFNNKEIVIQTENKNLEIKITNTALPHLLGIHYIGVKNKIPVRELIHKIKTLHDEDIFKEIFINNPNTISSVKNRINNFEEFMKNLENAILVENTYDSTLKSQHFFIQTKENKILHLGLIDAGYSDIPVEFDVIDKKYLETFIQEKTNKRYKDTQIVEHVKNIYEYVNDELKYFSFDIEKQEKLEEVAKIDKNYDYHEALNKSIEEIKKEKQTIDMWSNWKNRSYDDDWER